MTTTVLPQPWRDAAAFAFAAAALAWRERPRPPRRAVALATAAIFVAGGWLRPPTPIEYGAEYGFALPIVDESDPRLAALERQLEVSEQERGKLRTSSRSSPRPARAASPRRAPRSRNSPSTPAPASTRWRG